MLQFLAPSGELLMPLPKGLNDNRLLEFYQQMMLVRLYDKKAIALQRTGQLGTYPSHLGAEAIGIGTGYAMEKADVLVPYYRDMPIQWVRGVSMEHNLLYWGGDERGSDFPHLPIPKSPSIANHTSHPSADLPFCVPIATQCTHGVGVAAALKIQQRKQAVVVNLGDGATSKGDFTESINCAGVWQLPVVFVINNNQWAISVPRKLQSAAHALSDKALGAGIPAMQIDGNDIVAVYHSVREALARARRGLGASVIEMISYRLGDHTTADDASRYRSDDELDQAWHNEPLRRLKAYLLQQRLWSEAQEAEWIAQCQQQIESAVANYLAVSPQPPEASVDYLYAQLPPEMADQRQALIRKAMQMEAGDES
uniref:pyruvate dehydrogenase (acetyl-transferring) E1 component subunit alpha n=1 Tax=Thaumasiovibrio occultus TaxID=1891184 RepID=UPI000B362FCA|nr:pyruvate dehydrogenase (acetyl-transferring) E1 component subunit alpha [Thaumasiovibrio occultus]